MKVLERVLNIKFSAPYWAVEDRRSYDIITDLPPARGGCKLLIDHHPSNVELGKKRALRSFVRPDYPSTSLLVWELLSKETDLNEVKPLVDLTSKVDSGEYDEWTIKFTVVIRRLFSFPGRESSLKKVVRELMDKLPSNGESLFELKTIFPVWMKIEEEEKEFLSWIDSLPEKLGDGRNLAVITYVGRGPGYLSPLIHYKIQNLVDLETVLRISEEGKARLSIRSKRGSKVNALDLAKKLGGGGHERAAGATIDLKDIDTLKRILEESGFRVITINKG